MNEAKEYALRHLPAHLADAGLTSKLYELARHSGFPRTQTTVFPSEPRIALSAPATALRAAVANNDTLAVAEFTLRYVGKTIDLAAESPIVAERAGSLERAWQLAERPHRDDRSLWYLLLAWDLRVHGHTDDSNRTLDRLLRSRPTEIPTSEWMDEQNWRNTAAVMLVAILAEHISPTLRSVASALLREFHRNQALAPTPPDPIPTWNEESSAATDDGIRLAFAGDITGARQALNRIRLDGHGYRTDAYRYVVHVLRTQGHEASAVELVAELLRPVVDFEELVSHRIRACADLARLIDQRAATDLLVELTTTAASLEDVQHRFQACRAIARARLAVTGAHELQTLVANVVGDSTEAARAAITVALCPDLVASGQVPAALELVADLPHRLFWEHFTHDAYAAMARTLASRGDLDGALEMAERIEIPGYERTVEGEALQARADAFAGLAAMPLT